jgi:hypothetical protein
MQPGGTLHQQSKLDLRQGHGGILFRRLDPKPCRNHARLNSATSISYRETSIVT